MCTNPSLVKYSSELCFYFSCRLSPLDSKRALRRQPWRTAILFFTPLQFFPPPFHITTDAFAPQPIALKVHSMSSLTHLRRQRKERGCHWDNRRRNKVMFRGKHSLGIVLYLCSLTQFSVPPLPFSFCSDIFPPFIFLRRVSVFCVLDDSISLLCSLFSFCISNGNFSFRNPKLKVSVVQAQTVVD